MFSKIAIGFGLIIMVVAGGIYYLSQNAGKIVESMIEEQGSHVMKVDVQLDAVELNFPDLKASIRGLTVANPEGFQTERAISLGEISVKMAKDWPSDLIVIEEVMINAPEITYEIGSGGSNIATIQKNVEDFMKAISSQKKKSGIGLPSNEKDQSKGPKIIINDFYLKNGKVNVSASLFQGKSLSTALPDIHLQDIGKDKGGASPAEVVQQLIAAITDKAGGAASSLDLSQLGLSDISGKAAQIGAKAKEAAEDAIKGATEQLGGAVSEKLGGAGDALGGAVKGLFGN